MEEFTDAVVALAGASPAVLAMLLGMGAIGLAAFAIYVVFKAHRGDRG